jgi:hypothetical protein
MLPNVGGERIVWIVGCKQVAKVEGQRLVVFLVMSNLAHGPPFPDKTMEENKKEWKTKKGMQTLHDPGLEFIWRKKGFDGNAPHT